MNKTDILALKLSGTYGHKTSTRPPSCVSPRQLTIYTKNKEILGGSWYRTYSSIQTSMVLAIISPT